MTTAVQQLDALLERHRDGGRIEYSDLIALRAALYVPAPVQGPIKPPGMAVQALAGEIIEALLADEKDGGYDLTAGLFGAAFSKLVRRWAVAEWNAPQDQQPAEVPLLSIGELADLTAPWAHIRSDYSIGIARATEKLIRQKAGLQ